MDNDLNIDSDLKKPKDIILDVKEDNKKSVKDMVKKLNNNINDLRKNKQKKVLLRSDKIKTVKQLVKEYEKKIHQPMEDK